MQGSPSDMWLTNNVTSRSHRNWEWQTDGHTENISFLQFHKRGGNESMLTSDSEPRKWLPINSKRNQYVNNSLQLSRNGIKQTEEPWSLIGVIDK